MENLRQSHWWKHFELDTFVLATFDSFKASLCNAPGQNVVTVYVTGHTGEGGELVFNKDDTGRKMELLGPDYVAPHITIACKGVNKIDGGGTIECVVLNACYNRRRLGIALREQGVQRQFLLSVGRT